METRTELIQTALQAMNAAAKLHRYAVENLHRTYETDSDKQRVARHKLIQATANALELCNHAFTALLATHPE